MSFPPNRKPAGKFLHGRFAHRVNRDGTFDSICRDCFVTVATAKRENDLAKPEKDHVCDPWVRDRYEVSDPAE